MTDLTALKAFCTDNNLSNEQIGQLFKVIKGITDTTIQECYKAISGTLEKRIA